MLLILQNRRWRSLLSVGDWFLAESHSWRPGEGSRHTGFSTHGPAISRCIREFDRELADRLREQGVTPAASLDWALMTLNCVSRDQQFVFFLRR